MANEQNLIPGCPPGLTPEERQRNARKAGIASGEARRKRRTLREAAQTLLSAKLMLDQADPETLAELGIEAPTNADGLMLIALTKAARGDVEAMRFVRDTGGELPTNKVEIGGIEDKPLEVLDLSALSDNQLRELAQKRMEQSPESE